MITLHDGKFVRELQKRMNYIKPSRGRELEHWDIDVDTRPDGTRIIKLWTERGAERHDGTWCQYDFPLLRVTMGPRDALRWEGISLYKFDGQWGHSDGRSTSF